ncbi:amidohydrolase [Microbacterium sp. I2]|uniref:amidohydrolase n=1 Tax=Microbacterium sp. I2 TaxID=3391826 RepID=UPI003ED90911
MRAAVTVDTEWEHSMGKKSSQGPRNEDQGGISRRGLLIGSGTAAAAAVLSGGPAAAAPGAGAIIVAGAGPAYTNARAARAGGGQDVLLVNGRIHTMDDAGTVVEAVRIASGRITAVGKEAQRSGNSSNRIDLGGRTVIPGLIESHTHFVSLANRPGYHVAEWELAKDVAGVLAALVARRPEVPEGEFLTAMGAGTPRIFAEGRMPTLAEIDAAVPDRPVFLYQNFNGPARVNTLGKQFFQSVTDPSVAVADDGSITGDAANFALYHLRIRQSEQDKRRSALDAMAFSAKIGITLNYDQVLFATPNGTLDPSAYETQPNDGLRKLNHYRMYDPYLSLNREGAAYVRLWINYLHQQGYIAALGGLDKQLPELRERLKNAFPEFGDDMVHVRGIGEWAAPFAAPSNPNGYAVWLEAQRLVAEAGWHNENAIPGTATDQSQIEQVVSTWESLDAEYGIQHLRWGLQHADHATSEQLARLKALGSGVSLSGFRWLSGTPRADGLPFGPAFKRTQDSGIPFAIHEDGVHIAPHNPWFALHYATTGLNVLGQQINPGQQITRHEALRAYTRGAAWFTGVDDRLGSIEAGKHADLVVLDKDYFTVSEAEMRDIRPVMTFIDGSIVHDTGVVRGRRDWQHDSDHVFDETWWQ